MNILDIIIILSISVGFFIGWKLRAIHLIGMIIALCFGIWIANHYHQQFVGLFHNLPATVDQTLAWLTTFLAAVISISIIASFVAKAFELIRLKWLDHLLGAILAVVFVLSLLTITLYALNTMSKTYHWKIIKTSTFASPLLDNTQPAINYILQKYPKLKHPLLK